MANQTLDRVTFRTSRLMDFCSEKELIAQTGHDTQDWPLVALKELMDNSLDPCEEGRVAPVINVTVNEHGITVQDNGPGLPKRLSRPSWIIVSGYLPEKPMCHPPEAHRATL